MPHQVLFDLNSYSKVAFFNQGVTGINRVTYELAKALLDNKGCVEGIELKLSSLAYPQFTNEFVDYFVDSVEADFLALSKFEKFLYGAIKQTKLPVYKGQVIGKIIGQKAFRKSKIDIVHSPFHDLSRFHENKTSSWFYTIHDIIALTSPDYFEKSTAENLIPFFKKIADKGNFFISVSDYTKEQFCDYFKIPREKVSTIPNAASKDLFYRIKDTNTINSVRKKYQVPEGDYILGLATLEPRKNIAGVIKAFYEVLEQSKRKDLYLVIAGKLGWKMQSIFSGHESNPELKDKVVFVGHILDQDLAALYSGAKTFVYASFEEGFGLPPLEAMQCGTPVISSSTSSIPEVVGNAGVLVNPHMQDELAHAINRFVSDDNFRQTFVEKGLSQAKNYTWDKTARQTMHAYKKYLEEAK